MLRRRGLGKSVGLWTIRFQALAVVLLVVAAPQLAQTQQMPMTANGDPTASARNCANAGYGDEISRLSACWVMQMASPQQRAIGNCIMMNRDWASAGFCMAGRICHLWDSRWRSVRSGRVARLKCWLCALRGQWESIQKRCDWLDVWQLTRIIFGAPLCVPEANA